MQSIIELDQLAAAQLYQFIANQTILSKAAVVIGVGFVYLIPLVLLLVWFTVSRKVALRAVLAGLLSWVGLSKLIAVLVDRPRPSASLVGVKELVFHRPDTSFPSDHSAFLMAITLTFYLTGQRLLGHIMLGVTILVGIARVGIGVHYPGDVLAGWLVGAVVAFLFHLVSQPFNRYIGEPVVQLAKRFKL